MKFAEHLSAHITPEWRKQYIQYEVPAAAGVWEDSEGPPSRQSDLRGRLPLLLPPRAGRTLTRGCGEPLRHPRRAGPSGPRRPSPPPQPRCRRGNGYEGGGPGGRALPAGAGARGGRASRRWGIRGARAAGSRCFRADSRIPARPDPSSPPGASAPAARFALASHPSPLSQESSSKISPSDDFRHPTEPFCFSALAHC